MNPRENISRRRFIGFTGGAAGMAALAACGAPAAPNKPASSPRTEPKPAPRPTVPPIPSAPTTNRSTGREMARLIPTQVIAPPKLDATAKALIEQDTQDVKTVGDEINKLYINPSQTEQKRWRERGFQRSSIPPISKDTIKGAQDRVGITLQLMEESEIDELSTAAKDFKQFVREGLANHSLYPKEKMPPGQDAIALFLNNGGKIDFHILISYDLAYNLDSASLAEDLAHEIEHVRNAIAFDKSLLEKNPDLTVDQRIAEQRARRQNPEEHVAEETRGYGLAAKVHIRLSGLMGRVVSGYRTQRAAAFIRGGSDLNSPEWKKYVKNVILKIPD